MQLIIFNLIFKNETHNAVHHKFIIHKPAKRYRLKRWIAGEQRNKMKKREW